MDQRSKHEPAGDSGASPDSVPPAGQGGHPVPLAVPPRQCQLPLSICLLLALAVWIVFGQTLWYGFVNYDDNLYVYENPMVEKGVTWDGIGWAFTHNLVENWHPLTVISYMADASCYGLKPAGYHLTNVVLHTIAVVLLFVVLREMTGTLWQSAFVAAVFAIHPLHVESVAWISERKDVLSGLLFMLTLWAYVRYVHESAVPVSASTFQRFTLHASRYYWLALLLFALGLMAKPMLVTVPFVLLLLDYWPLQRLNPSTLQRFNTSPRHPMSGFTLQRLLVEKIPFLALSAAACVATLVAQKEIIKDLPLSLRVSNALVSCVTYPAQMVWPAHLAVLYPYPEQGLPFGKVAGSVALLALISTVVFLWRAKRPWLLMGWLWYLGMLVPVIGLVQSGLRAHADRYTYLPQIGLYILMAWGAVELCGRQGWRRIMLVSAGGGVLAGLLAVACLQCRYWQNSVSLWTHTLACAPVNSLAHYNLGNVLAGQGKLAEAIQHYQWALRIKPDYAQAQCNWGSALVRQGRMAEAAGHFEQALHLAPHNVEACCDLGVALAGQGKWTEAIQNYQRALQLAPDFAQAQLDWGNALARQGKFADALQHFQQALALATAQGNTVLADTARARLQSLASAPPPPPNP